MDEKISIVIPVYNAEKYLVKCLESVVNQTYKNLEIICVNGESQDKSLSILKDFQSKDSRIIIIDTINEGVSISRNKGLSKVTGEYVMFVDADDWIDLDNCENALNEIKKNDADVVMWSYMREFAEKALPKVIFNKQKVIFENKDVKKIHRRFIGLLSDEFNQIENADALCPCWGKLYKTSLIKDNNIQFTDIRKIGTYEDGLFNLEVFKYVQKAVYIEKFHYHYRKDNDNSITSKYNPNLYPNWLNLYDLMNQYISDNDLSQEYYDALYNRIFIGILGLGLNIVDGDFEVIKKIKKIKEVLSSELYRKASKYSNLHSFRIHWKVFYGCAKYNFSIGVYVLLLCIKKGIGKK